MEVGRAVKGPRDGVGALVAMQTGKEEKEEEEDVEI